MAAPQLKFTYYAHPGRGEFTRLLFTFGGVAFEDERIQRAEMPARKPTLPLGQLPVLQVNGTTYAQSMAIARYAAKRAGLYPQDAELALRADMVCETIVDLANTFIAIKFVETDAAVKAAKTKKFVEEIAPKSYAALEQLVLDKFFVGDSASIADVHLFDFVTNAMALNFPELSMAAYPKLEGVLASVEANANIAAYIAKRAK